VYPHAIRLRGPWELGGTPPRRVTMPCRWEDVPSGRAQFVRRFGYPGRIDTFERVWLVLTGLSGAASLALNGTGLGRHAGDYVEHDVTALLRERNVLAVEFESRPGGKVWEEAGLEVRRTAFLRGVRFQVEPSVDGEVIRASGLVVGTSTRPLELYLLRGNRSVGYSTAEPAEEGQPFQLASEPLPQQAGDGATGPCRIELVDAATVWYFVEDDPAAGRTTPDSR
jgi:hypothetical protein